VTGLSLAAVLLSILALAVTVAGQPRVRAAVLDPDLVARGARLFNTETFAGNGRTCATCHPPENNFTLDPAFIATLPPTDPLFVAEFNPALAQLEDSQLLRQFALIRENVDGFDRPAVLRGVPHTFALQTSVASPEGPRTGWSGDGSPDGTLRLFSLGAIVQHFPRTLNRVPGVDFRLPTDAELDALEAFMLSLGRQAELALPLPLKGVQASFGQDVFLDPVRGKCDLCHLNAGANAKPPIGDGNASFDTGIAQLAHPVGQPMPPDGGFGRAPRADGGFGDGRFNIPPLVEAAGTPPFFHNNAVDTIEKAVAFYTGPEFADSLGGIGVGPISLTPEETDAIAAFLRVLNALEDIRSAIESRRAALATPQPTLAAPPLATAAQAVRTAIRVLDEVGLHPEAATLLDDARELPGQCDTTAAIAKLEGARALLIDVPPDDPGPGVILTAPASRGGPLVRRFTAGGAGTDFGLCAYDLAFGGGVFLAAGRVPGGGQPDIVTGAGPGGGPHVRTFRADGLPGLSFLAYDASFLGGVRVAACDVNGDGRADVVTGAGPGGGPHVRVFDGVTGVELAGFLAYDASFTGGVFVACGDVDGDSIPELITGADAGGGPHVRILKLDAAAPGGVVPFLDFLAYDPGFSGGVRVAAGNVDGSDRASIVLGAGPGGGPHVRAVKLVGGALVDVASFFAYAPAFSGGVFVGAGDVDGDGRAEIVTGPGPGGGPHVRVFTGAGVDTGIGFFAYNPSFSGGVTVAVGP
jgi:FG-GAP repeat protein